MESWFTIGKGAVFSGTDTGPVESREGDLAPAPNLHLHGKRSTPPRHPITPKKKYEERTPGPSLHQDLTPVHALARDPGPDANPEGTRSVCTVCRLSLWDGPQMVICPEKGFCFDMNVMSSDAL